MKGLNFIGIILLVVLALSCNTNDKPKGFDYGKVADNVYTNSFFGFELKLPVDWVVQTKEQTDNLMKRGEKLVAGDDENMKAIIKASEINYASLVAVFKYEVGAAVDYNPSLMLIAENLKNTPGIKNGSDYLFQARKLMKQSQIQYDFIDEEFEKEIINDHDFYLMHTSIDYMGVSIKQIYFSTVKNGFCLSTIISYTDEEQKMELLKTVNSMKFDIEF